MSSRETFEFYPGVKDEDCDKKGNETRDLSEPEEPSRVRRNRN